MTRVNPLSSSRPIRASRRGSVIIFVLGVILLAAFLLTRLMDRAAVEISAEGKAANRGAMRQEAFSALESSFAVLADYAAVDNGLHAAEQGWGHPLQAMNYVPAPGYSVEATVEDESGKFSLPAADATALQHYLDAIGCPPTSQDKLADALLEWTHSDHVAEGADSDAISMADAPFPYQPPQRPLRTFKELRDIPSFQDVFFDNAGHWNELGRRFCAGASVFSFTSANANTVGPDVLTALGANTIQLDALSRARANSSGPGYFATPADLAAAWGQGTVPAGLGIDATCLHLSIVVKQGGREYRLDAWIGTTGTGPARPATTAVNNPATTAASAAKDTAASVRTSQRKRIDYPFNILELRENDGS